MPNVVVNELEIQYSANKLRAATYGRGLWETDLYASEPDDYVNDINENNYLKIFPNPNTGVFSISAKLKGKQDIIINIFSLKGNKVYTENASAIDSFNKSVDVSYLSKETYIVQITLNNTKYSGRIVINK
jgi:hypothetical protein